MDVMQTIVRFFQEGGPFMFPISIVLALGVADLALKLAAQKAELDLGFKTDLDTRIADVKNSTELKFKADLVLQLAAQKDELEF